MATFQPFQLTAAEIGRKVASGEFRAADVAEFYIGRNEKHAKDLNTNLYFDKSAVQAQVRVLDERLKNGEKPRLAGVPVLVKDNICTKGVPTTCASKILAGFKPPYDAHVVDRLKAEGAIILGKANCDEFAMGSSNENSAFGAVKNPWDTSRVPGGSSGGSAAAVAADLAPLALGSDTGGSIRQPASFCGIVGLKPTYGVVSRYGLVAFGSSLDQIGPFARSVTDAALLLDVISGHDRRDSTSANRPATKLQAALVQDIKQKPLKIGLVKEFFGDGMDAGTKAALSEALGVYRGLGATIVDVSLPYLKYSISAYYLIATAEASANLARFDGVRYGLRADDGTLSLKDMYRKTRSQGFGREVKQRIMLGTFALSSGYYDAYYAKANRARHLIGEDFAKAFEQCDLLVSPTSPTTAFKIGEKSQDPLAMYLSDICTIGINLAGIPGISIPCGFDRQGLPVGMQLMAPRFGEEQLLRGAYLYEQATKWNEQSQPNL
jgi:aspartyl-tRNA(Asn)/glutamyl-tRNA(Gln) amidotransferase subunit A